MATVQPEPQVFDDLHYADGKEIPADEKVEFSIDQDRYEIDLTTENAEALREKLGPEIAVATKVTTRRRPSGSTARKHNASRAGRDQTKRMREWAEGQGIELNPQGRIPNNVREMYFKAHPGERDQSS